jgi:hypothetical protein
MSNSARRRFSRLISTVNTASQHQPRSSVGAGYRCGVRQCQTQKSPKKRFFSGLCGHRFCRRSRSGPPLYIEGALAAATGTGKHPALHHLSPKTKAFRGVCRPSTRANEPAAGTDSGPARCGTTAATRDQDLSNVLKYNIIFCEAG